MLKINSMHSGCLNASSIMRNQNSEICHILFLPRTLHFLPAGDMGGEINTKGSLIKGHCTAGRNTGG